MKFCDNTSMELPCRGEVTIKIFDLKGELLRVYDAPNTIVNGARDIMSHLLVGDGASVRKISKLGVGRSSTLPNRTNSALGDEVLKVDIISNTFPATGQVEMTALLDYNSTANNKTLNEVGLFTTDGTLMFARQVHAAIAKTSSIQIQYLWRIIFT